MNLMTEKKKSDIQEIHGYRVMHIIGEGAASTIYAVHNAKNKLYALKHVLLKGSKDDRFLEQAETEVKISAKLDHPAVRKIHKMHKIRPGWARTEVVVLMELIDADALDRKSIPDLAQRVDIFLQVAEGLAHMNQRGFVHADMKPTNILVDEELKATIIDLGQACKIGTEKKRIQGTPGYMAPEQADRKPITPATDVYNFGATMYWLLTRKEVPTARPDGGTGGTVKLPLPPSHFDPRIPKDLSELVMRSINPKPHARYENMRIVADKLKEILDGLSAPTAS
jgi:serine/threonine protein kinase